MKKDTIQEAKDKLVDQLATIEVANTSSKNATKVTTHLSRAQVLCSDPNIQFRSLGPLGELVARLPREIEATEKTLRDEQPIPPLPEKKGAGQTSEGFAVSVGVVFQHLIDWRATIRNGFRGIVDLEGELNERALASSQIRAQLEIVKEKRQQSADKDVKGALENLEDELEDALDAAENWERAAGRVVRAWEEGIHRAIRSALDDVPDNTLADVILEAIAWDEMAGELLRMYDPEARAALMRTVLEAAPEILPTLLETVQSPEGREELKDVLPPLAPSLLRDGMTSQGPPMFHDEEFIEHMIHVGRTSPETVVLTFVELFDGRILPTWALAFQETRAGAGEEGRASQARRIEKELRTFPLRLEQASRAALCQYADLLRGVREATVLAKNGETPPLGDERENRALHEIATELAEGITPEMRARILGAPHYEAGELQRAHLRGMAQSTPEPVLPYWDQGEENLSQAAVDGLVKRAIEVMATPDPHIFESAEEVVGEVGRALRNVPGVTVHRDQVAALLQASGESSREAWHAIRSEIMPWISEGTPRAHTPPERRGAEQPERPPRGRGKPRP